MEVEDFRCPSLIEVEDFRCPSLMEVEDFRCPSLMEVEDYRCPSLEVEGCSSLEVEDFTVPPLRFHCPHRLVKSHSLGVSHTSLTPYIDWRSHSQLWGGEKPLTR